MNTRMLQRNRMVLLGDLLLIVVSGLGSFVLRTDMGPLFRYYLPQAYWLIGISLVVKPLVFYAFGLYRRLWAYASTQELKQITMAVTTSSVVVSLIVSLFLAIRVLPHYPRSTLPIDWLLTLALVGGLRFSLRILAESQSQADRYAARRKRILIVGAGDAGALVVREMLKSAHIQVNPVCFLDDDPMKQKQQIHGIPVVGRLDDLARVVDQKHIDQVVIAIPSAPGRVIRKVTEVCQEKGVPFQTMPGIYELIGGNVNVSRLREVEITDLLRRDVTKIDDELVGAILEGKRVLVTGAGGSIGRELCRQVARWSPASLTLLGHGENSIFETLVELKGDYPQLVLTPVIADIRDAERLAIVFEKAQPQVVFHAAAHKHVPLMEVNVEEAIMNNVIGTQHVAHAAVKFGVERMVMISTDKAIRPTSVMGAAKRLGEMVILDAARRYNAPFSVVRFGNVLGSRGSVIPLFKRQIARGGPVTVTHPDMQRYFMTIPEAVHLVLQASAMGHGAEVFVLNMGEQVKILDLAEDLIRLSGLEPGRDIEIVFSGVRPGEKLSEELWDQWVQYEPTAHPDIVLLADEDLLSGDRLNSLVEELEQCARLGDTGKIIDLLDDNIPGADVQTTPPPDLISIL